MPSSRMFSWQLATPALKRLLSMAGKISMHMATTTAVRTTTSARFQRPRLLGVSYGARAISSGIGPACKPAGIPHAAGWGLRLASIRAVTRAARPEGGSYSTRPASKRRRMRRSRPSCCCNWGLRLSCCSTWACSASSRAPSTYPSKSSSTRSAMVGRDQSGVSTSSSLWTAACRRLLTVPTGILSTSAASRYFRP